MLVLVLGLEYLVLCVQVLRDEILELRLYVGGLGPGKLELIEGQTPCFRYLRVRMCQEMSVIQGTCV